jgi:F-type H+-transporting ATPase subunit b
VSASLLLLLQEGGAEHTVSPFDINTGLIFWTVLIFLLLMAILWKMAWPAILKSVEEREQKIQRQLDEAERARAEAAKLLEEQRRLAASSRAEAQEMLAKAKTLAQKEREALLAKARDEQDAMLERARREIDSEKDKAILALRKEAVDLSIAAASRLIEKNLDTAANKQLVLDYLKSIEQRA